MNARLGLLWMPWVVLVLVCPVWGQAAEGDRARALLEQGIALYEAKDFISAQETLLKVDRSKLSATERKNLDSYLQQARQAAREQASASQAYESAQQALKRGDLARAKTLFEQAADSKSLPEPVRLDARAQRALVIRKMEAGKTDAKPAPAAAVQPPEPAAKPAPKPDLGTDLPPPVEEAFRPVAPRPDVPAAPEAAPAPPVEQPAPKMTPAPPVAPAPPVEPVAEVPAVPPVEPVAEVPAVPPVELVPKVAPAPPVELARATPAAAAAGPKPAPVSAGPAGDDAQARLEALELRLRRAKAELALGNAALANEQVDRAIQHFQKALEIEPTYTPARERLELARSLVGEGGGGAGAIARLVAKRRIRAQMVRSKYAQAMQRSHEAMQAIRGPGDFDRATQEAQYARSLLETNRNYLDDAEYQRKKLETEQRLDYISRERQRWEESRVAEQQKEVERRRRDRIRLLEQQKAEKIRTLKSRVNELSQRGQYKEAVEILARICKLEPSDSQARNMLGQFENFVMLLDGKEAHRTALREEHRQMVDIRWSQVPWYEMLRYPRDWQEISLRRRPFAAGEVAESEADRAVRRELRKVLPKLEFPGIGFGDVIQFFRDVSNLNIHPKWEALKAANIDERTPVNVKLTNVTLEKALRTVLDDVGGVNPLDYIVDEGVITISTKDDLSRQAITRVYDIRDLIFQVPNFAGPRINLDQTGQQVSGGTGTTGTGLGGGGGIGGGGGGLFDTGQQTTTTGTQVQTMSRQELVDSILEVIRQSIAPDTWRGGEPPGMIGSIRELNGQIVVTQTRKNHRDLLELLQQLRETRAILINVEARFIRVNSGFLNRIGFNLDFYFNLGSTLGGGGVGADPWLSTADPTGGPGIPLRGPSGWGPGGTWSSKLTPMHLDLGSWLWTEPPLPTAIASSIGNITSTGMTLSGVFLDDIQVDFLVTATQAHESSRSLTCPRVTFFNGQRAYVAVQVQRAYISELDPVVSENAVAFDPTVSVVSTGTVLDVEGTVSADRRYVTLTLRPQITSNVQFFEYAIQEITGADGTTEQWRTGIIQVPQIEVQQLETTVSVPDGGTLLLGGQKLAAEREREMGVPILSKIPIINRAFTNKILVRDDETLLILVKPKIIIQREVEEQAFPPSS